MRPDARLTPPSTFALALGAAAALCACRAFAPTIPDRQGRGTLDVGDVPLSIAEERSRELEAAPTPPPGPSHLDVLARADAWPRVGDEATFAVEFRDAPIAQVVLFLAQRAGLNIQLDPALEERVDVSFPSVTVDTALRALLAPRDLQLVEDPPGVFRVVRSGAGEPARATFHLQSVAASEVEANLRALVDASSRLVIDASQGLVMLDGTRGDVAAVARFLDAADRLKRQVLVEARILEITLTDDFELGLSGSASGSIDGNAFEVLQNLAGEDDSFELSLTSRDGSIEATLDAISRYVGTNLVSSPRVLALSGTPADIQVIREVPYVNVTSTTTGTTAGVGSQTIEEVQFKEAGVKLKVTPTIQENGTIQVHIEQEFSEVAEFFNGIPVIDARSLVTDFLVADRQTVVLGGLMQDQRSETDKGIPGLKDLPLIGRLFRSDVDAARKRELLVFLTPRVVDAREAARLVDVLRRQYVDRLNDSGVRPVHARGQGRR